MADEAEHDSPIERVVLQFDKKAGDRKKHWRDNLSAIAYEDGTLFVSDDENPEVCRLQHVDGNFEHDGVCAIADVVGPLPAGNKGEMDIEGLAVQGERLWVVGSHALARKRPEDGQSGPEAISRLAQVRDDANRYFLGYLAIRKEKKKDKKKGCELMGGAHLPMRLGEGSLIDLLVEDVHLGRYLKPWGPYLGIPAKENGFDVEGIAVGDEGHVFLGLRGPVLRGWAMVLELKLADGDKSELKPVAVPSSSSLYRKHFFQLGGLGLRELVRYGNDLLMLAGPTMDLDGPVHVYRWRDAWSVSTETVLSAADVGEPVLRLPYGQGCDHAEGITALADGKLLVVYDSPSDARLKGKSGYMADVFRVA